MAAAILSVASEASKLLGGLFHRGPDPRIKADIIPAYQRGDVAYLYAWINDQPPHPADSVAAARQALAHLTGTVAVDVPQQSGYGGRIANPPPSPIGDYGPPAGGIPVRTPEGTGFVPYWR